MDNWVAKPATVPEDGKDLFLIPGGMGKKSILDTLPATQPSGRASKIATCRINRRDLNTASGTRGACGHRLAEWVCA